jgi:hypothetical protein
MIIQSRRAGVAAVLTCLAVWAAPSLAAADEGAAERGLAACGHLDEMSAAREALADGDRETALLHLRAARALLVECEARSEEQAALPGRAVSRIDSI